MWCWCFLTRKNRILWKKCTVICAEGNVFHGVPLHCASVRKTQFTVTFFWVAHFWASKCVAGTVIKHLNYAIVLCMFPKLAFFGSPHVWEEFDPRYFEHQLVQICEWLCNFAPARMLVVKLLAPIWSNFPRRQHSQQKEIKISRQTLCVIF